MFSFDVSGIGGQSGRAVVGAATRAMAVIEFDLAGRVTAANDRFLKLFGYARNELLGQHHRLLVDRAYAERPEYREFWTQLAKGQVMDGRFQRFAKDGSERWLQASYSPILDRRGAVTGVIKLATDITEGFQRERDAEARLGAIDRVMGTIEFDLSGHVLTANRNFLTLMGYSLEEIRGQHHRCFVSAEEAASEDYRRFWAGLAAGQADARRYRRIAKGGREVWIQASYNPVFDANGKPFKVIKFATDITEAVQQQANFEGQMAAINRVMGVIEFDLKGTILHANENFLRLVQYSLDELKGHHHRMFVSAEAAAAPAYAEFWRRLESGAFDAGRYCRRAKDGSELWIQASYNPVLDANGRPFKVVKFATDITAQVAAEQAMARIVDSARQIAASVSTAAREIASGNTDLAGRTESQAASVEETSSSIERLLAAAQETRRDSGEANRMSSGLLTAIRDGNAVVSSVVGSMGNIEAATAKISSIIAVIDGIAFQTNILALNAAVEAARAGAEGRGFAVVAGEVRSLAQRCAESAREIRQLIVAASEEVKRGSSSAREAGDAMKSIFANVEQVHETIAGIAEAMNDQASGLGQINQAVADIDRSAQQNAALVEQMAAASESLEHQAAELFSLVGSEGKTKTEAAPAGTGARRAA